MGAIKTEIYHYLDKNGINGHFSISMGVAFNEETENVDTIFPKRFHLAPNCFDLTNDEYEKVILDYIFDTAGVRINSLVYIDNYSSVDGKPFILEIYRDGMYGATFSLAFKTIDGTLVLTDNDKIISLGNIEVINGDLQFRESSIQSLGNLKYVNGSVYIKQFAPPFTALKSLGKLEEVNGNLILKGSPLEDLGNLKKVLGTLNLCKTNVSTLRNLEYVKGDLFLPKAKKEILDTSKVNVIGNIKYFNN